MSSLSFASLLSKPMAETETVENLPIGTYVASITGFKPGVIEGKPYETLDITWVVSEACEDVDPDQLEKFGTPVRGEKMRQRFLFSTEDERNFRITENQLKELFKTIEMPESNTYQQNLADMVNHYARITVGHRANPQNPARPYVEIKGVSAA